MKRKPFFPPEAGKRSGLRQDSIHDVALMVGECCALLKLHLQDRIAIENKVIKRLVEEKAVPELIFTPPVRPARESVATAALAAIEGSWPGVAMTVTCRRTRSASSAGRRPVSNKPNHRQHRMLRVSSKRPRCRRASEAGDEVASPHRRCLGPKSAL
jgi:hypothetical protein